MHTKLRMVLWIVAVLVVPTLVFGEDGIPGMVVFETKGSQTQIASVSSNGSVWRKAKRVGQYAKKRSGKTVADVSSEGTTYVIELENAADTTDVLQQLKADPTIRYAEPVYPVTVSGIPNDPYFHNQTYLQQPSLEPLLLATGSASIVVAVVDTGVDTSHVDLQGEIQDGGYNFYGSIWGLQNDDYMDYHGHGTHLSGIIAADQNNGIGISGINNTVKILPVRFLDSGGRGNQLDAAAAIRYAVDHNARIINCSWGFTAFNQALKDAFDYAAQNGVIVFAAAGNSNTAITEYPAGFDSVISVASVDTSLSRSYFSSYGAKVLFSAFGNSIFSLAPHNQYAYMSGTSQSTAVMSGIAAKALSIKPSLTKAQLIDSFIQSASNTTRNDSTGYGVVQGTSLLSSLTGSTPETIEQHYSVSTALSEPSIENVLNFPNPVPASGTTFGFSANSTGTLELLIFDTRGTQVKRLNGVVLATYNTYAWDGKSESGEVLPNGTYFYVVKADLGTKTLKAKGKLAILR
ncbi:MAG: S8 family serine peptidase [Candidatus Margulisiibacteriota bacterium]